MHRILVQKSFIMLINIWNNDNISRYQYRNFVLQNSSMTNLKEWNHISDDWVHQMRTFLCKQYCPYYNSIGIIFRWKQIRPTVLNACITQLRCVARYHQAVVLGGICKSRTCFRLSCLFYLFSLNIKLFSLNIYTSAIIVGIKKSYFLPISKNRWIRTTPYLISSLILHRFYHSYFQNIVILNVVWYELIKTVPTISRIYYF